MLDEAGFQERVLGAAGPIVVDVTANWCAPCQLLGAVLEKLAGEWQDHVSIHEIDADADEAFCARWQVECYPTLLLFHGGALQGRIEGFEGHARLRAGIVAFVAEKTGAALAARVGEAAFQAAADAAQQHYDDATIPAAEALGRALDPVLPAHEAAMAELDRQMQAGEIGAEEGRLLVAEANTRLREIAAPELAAQRETTAGAIEAYRREMAEATAAFVGQAVSTPGLAALDVACDGWVCLAPQR